jgi:hypothetical protein
MHDPKCLPTSLCAECEVYDVGMEASKPDPNEAFHAHLHDVIQQARAGADTREPTKVPVRIKRADFLVAHYAKDSMEPDYVPVKCDSLSEAQAIVDGRDQEQDDCRIFIAADRIRLQDYERDFAYVGEEIRKEQAQQQSDHEG